VVNRVSQDTIDLAVNYCWHD